MNRPELLFLAFARSGFKTLYLGGRRSVGAAITGDFRTQRLGGPPTGRCPLALPVLKPLVVCCWLIRRGSFNLALSARGLLPDFSIALVSTARC